MNIYVDRIAIWQAMPADGLFTKNNAPGVVYFDKQNIAQTSDTILTRYAKNYRVKDGDNELNFSLFILTPDQDQIAVEKMLDEIATTFDFKYIKSALEKSSLSDFVWSNKYYERSL